MEMLLVLQCMQRYKCVYTVSDTLECDDRTVMASMMDNSEETSEWTFPKEKPQRKDFDLWRTALLHVTSSIQTSLGPYIRHPHKNARWYTSSDNLYLYKENSNGMFDSFRQSLSARTTRRQKCIPCLTSYLPPHNMKTSKYASVTIQEGMTDIIVTSTASCFISDEHPRHPIPNILRSQTNPNLWKGLTCDEDGLWIRDALLDGTLYLSSYGLWQPEIDPSVSSCAFIVKCIESNQELKCTWVEKGECVSNYRAELLDAVGYLLVMKAVLPDIRATDCDVTTLPKCKAFVTAWVW